MAQEAHRDPDGIQADRRTVDRRKRRAAKVMVAAIATLAASWGVHHRAEIVLEQAGVPAGAVAACSLDRQALRLELAETHEEADAVLEVPQGAAEGEPRCPQGTALRSAVEAQVEADFALIPCYAALVGFLLLMVADTGQVPSVRLWRGVAWALATAPALADLAENYFLLQFLRHDVFPRGALRLATTSKWSLLALGAVVTGLLAIRHGWKWATACGFPAAAAAVLLATGIAGPDATLLELGAGALALFWTVGLLRAIAVAVQPVPDELPGEDKAPAVEPQRRSDRDIGETDPRRAYPQRLAEAERTLLRQRRDSAELEQPDPAKAPLIGVGLSGGGIRSATFSLGFFQGMAARPGILRRIDFLSTVSGGGYFGAFFGRLLTRDFVQEPAHAEEALRERPPGILEYLRENGRYLAPSGAGDLLLAGAVLLRNWASVQLVLAVLLLAPLLLVQATRPAVDRLFQLSPPLASWFGSSTAESGGRRGSCCPP